MERAALRRWSNPYLTMNPTPPPPPNYVVVRAFRVVRLVAHLFRGLATTWMTFPRVSPAERSELVRRWSAQLVSIAGVHIATKGALPTGHFVIVANHISWVDIFAINSLRAVSFVAKKELADWPVAGRLLKNVGTLFIDRSKRRDTGRMVGVLAQHIREGAPLAFFPEGRVSHGVGVHTFNASLLQPAIDAQACVVPIAITYSPLPAFDYVNRTFLKSVWLVLGARDASVTLTILPAQTGDDRRVLSKNLEQAIRSQIQQAADAMEPDKASDHRA
jgi:1-acyl-sn-glycerol-3-phosphate acyltransferase